ncbi:MAG: 3'-5' exonuclease [Prevotellaceae bacterium]|nr:3'-5' exonuclease [Prevotellaceae bacterium]
MESILDNLNPGQRAAVEYNDGPSLVIAGAGSGKTRVLTFKIAYLIQQGYKPWNIRALTFTNKAADEMKNRIGRLVGDDNAHYIPMGTFHSIFARILRTEAELLGYNSQYTIYDEADSRSLIKSIVKEMNLDDKTYKPAAVHSRISMAKNHIISAQMYINDGQIFERDRQARMPEIGKIYVQYQQRCQNANAMDFDDLLMLTFKLFKEHDEVRQKWANKFKFVLVDEYQDTNRVQQQIVEQLTRESHKVCVVGDDAQSIYAFRGANIDNILDFNKVYPEAKLFKLEKNYRSTQRIVEAANSLIRHNVRQIQKNVFSENAEGDALVLKMLYSDREEAAVVCKDIKRLARTEGCSYSDFAILYRTNAQSRTFEDECLKQGIPYRIFGGMSFYQRKEIKDIVAYFRLVCNPNDEEAFKRIINYPTRGIGNTTVDKLLRGAQTFGAGIWEVASQPERFQIDLKGAALKKVKEFVVKMESFSAELATMNAYDLGQKIIMESGVRDDLFSSNDPDDITRQENLEEFMAALADFVEVRREEGNEEQATLSNFLAEISLQTDKESNDGNSAKVSMMTVHAAKGLEFPTVFIVGMEENIFPSQMSVDSPRQLEEERRLLYVAITRAEKHCILTCAKNRYRFGHLEYDVPSRFLRDIDQRLMRVEAMGEGDTSGYSARSQRRGFDSDERNTPYRGARFSGSDYPEYSSRMQNSRPVAGQFQADPQPKVTTPHREEQQIDPLSPSFRRQLDAARRDRTLGHGAQAGGFRQATQSQPRVPAGFKPVRQVPPSMQSATSAPSGGSYNGLSEGSVVEHQRFGIGTVIKLEGVGDNAKATVEFQNTGRKQLLLKFAKFTIVK